MRVWDTPPSKLCNKHLVAQHHEIHCIHSIITNGLKGFAHHPEVMRWRDRTNALVMSAHYQTATEMRWRGLSHNSMMLPDGTDSGYGYPAPWQPVQEQVRQLQLKGCGCKV